MLLRLIKSKRLQAWAGATVLLGLLLMGIIAINGVVNAPGATPTTSQSTVPEPDFAPTQIPVSTCTKNTISPDKSPAPTDFHRSINLWNVSPAQFKTNLLHAVGGRLLSRSLPDGTHEFLLPTTNNQQARLRVDARGNEISIAGQQRPVQDAVQLVHALDNPRATSGIRYLATPGVRRDEVRRLLHAVQLDAGSRAASRLNVSNNKPNELLVAVTQPPTEDNPQPSPTPPSPQTNAPHDTDNRLPPPDMNTEGPESSRLVGPVQVQVLEGLDAIIIKGRPEDVKRVQELVNQLVQYSKITEPTVEIYMLKHADASAMGQLFKQLYEEVYSAREGTMSITPLVAPNGLLLIGREESVKKISSLVEKLDQPIPPESRFRIFHLKHCPAEEAQETLSNFFDEEALDDTELVPRVHVVYDFRSNSLIVRASPRDMEEVVSILAGLDNTDSKSFNEVRVFKLKNSSAEVLGPVLRDALTGQMYGQRAQTGQAMGSMAAAQAQDYEKKSTRLQMVIIGGDGRRELKSGILTDAQVTADTRTNALVVTASADSMPLIAALIHELDRPPTIEAQVKVFTLVNGDASTMQEMLESIFTSSISGEEVAVRTGVVEDETSLVELHFAADVRTNSIIATGSAGALVVVEAVLSRLDGSDPRERNNAVYRLKNYKASDVATAINQYLSSKSEIESNTEGVVSEAERVAREVIVVAESSSNSLIISATPRYFKEIMKLIDEIDQRPAMAAIQVLIAEVSLDNFDEFGVELSLEDSLLFDRSLATGGLAIPGALFSNGTPTGGQAVTSLGTGQVNTELSYGGLVLSASSESVSALVRALSTCRRLKVLSRPQIMTLDNQAAQIVVGEDVPFITGTTFSEFGQQNSISYREVGLILTVTPIITPDGYVVMEIVATNSKVGAIDEGIPVSVADGQVIRSPRIEMISAQTVVSAVDGQTVVLGGLIIEDDETIVRRVPVISTIPVVGNLFRYEAEAKERKELLIIMTPRIVKNRDDAQRIACIEASRLHWCRADVERLHGGYGGDPFFGPGHGPGPEVIYPDETPTIDMMPESMNNSRHIEVVPTPSATTTSTQPQPISSNPVPKTIEADRPKAQLLNTDEIKSKLQILRPSWKFMPAKKDQSAQQTTPTTRVSAPNAPQVNRSAETAALSSPVQRLPLVQTATMPYQSRPQASTQEGSGQQHAGNNNSWQTQPVRPAAYNQGNY